MYLDLFHGRRHGEELNDWREPGPVFGPYSHFHLTYATEIKFGENGERLSIIDGMIHYAGIFYGDWAFIDDRLFEDSLDRQRRYVLFAQQKATEAVMPELQATVELYLSRQPTGWSVQDLGQARIYTEDDVPIEDAAMEAAALSSVQSLIIP